MYLLFRYHHMTPMQYFRMGYGERTVIKAFMHYEAEKRNEELEEIEQMRQNG